MFIFIPSLKLTEKAPENQWLEDDFPFRDSLFQVRAVSSRECIFRDGNQNPFFEVGELISGSRQPEKRCEFLNHSPFKKAMLSEYDAGVSNHILVVCGSNYHSRAWKLCVQML